MGKFEVISAADFINSGPAFGSREEKLAIQAELRARDQREVLAQKGRENYQTRYEQMTPVERVYNDLETLCEMNEQSNAGVNWKLRNAIAETWRLIEEL